MSGPALLLGVAVLVVAAGMFAFFLPFFYAALALLFPVAVMFAPSGREPRREQVVKGLKALVLMPVVFAAIAVPFRLLAHGMRFVCPAIPLDFFSIPSKYDSHQTLFRLFPAFDGWLGGCGLALFAVGAFVSWFRNLRVTHQIGNLATSKVHSAAVGLAEFHGAAHRIDGASDKPILLSYKPYSSKTGTKRRVLDPFYLEDETGRIRVDPGGAEFDDGTRIRFLDPIRFVCLTRRVERDQTGVERRLMPGDPVYLIGNVEMNREASPDAADADRLVVRPSTDWVKPNLLQRLEPGVKDKVPGGDSQHVFFLSDTEEQTAGKMMRETLWKTWQFVAIWGAMSAGLLWIAWRG